MIRTHEFNSVWWGSPVGISSDVQDLFQTAEQLSSELTVFDWIEYRIAFDDLPTQKLGPSNGARLVETQLSYQKNISRMNACPAGVTILPAIQISIDVNNFSPFSHERYAKLREVDSNRLASRYRQLANQLIENSPETCASVFYKSSLVGYVFGHINGTTAVFDLAVTAVNAQVSGQALYDAAGHMFNQAGASRMTSSFNAANLGALNAHVRMQCSFVKATSIWLLESKVPNFGDERE
jgi:hypothetical protein